MNLVVWVESEVGSRVDGSRPRARWLLADPGVSVVMVEHGDRLGRMNTELAEAALSAQGRRLVLLDDSEVTDDLVRDMSEVPPRPPPAPSAMTSATTRHGTGGTSMPAGRPRLSPRHRWTTIGLNLAGLPAATRDGHLRTAISSILDSARQNGARAIVIEDLDFAEARAEGRERAGSRPSRGRRGRTFRRVVAGIPTARFRDRLTQMASNAGLSVIVVDPAYTSRWGAEHWLAPLRKHHPEATGHHAAALVIGRRGLGHRARRRATGNQTAPEDAARPARARPRTTPAARTAPRKPATPPGPRQPPGTKTRRPHRTTAGDQAAHDRSEPLTSQDHVLLGSIGTVNPGSP